jgi:hypothetical protein
MVVAVAVVCLGGASMLPAATAGATGAGMAESAPAASDHPERASHATPAAEPSSHPSAQPASNAAALANEAASANEASAANETVPAEDADSPEASAPRFDATRLRKPVEISGKLTSGINEAFQLTLGGLFSQGANIQNTATVDIKNLMPKGGVVRVSGILHTDTKDLSNDWIATVNYLHPLVSGERDKLVGTLGLHVWHFPSVLNGKTDTVVDSGLAWIHSGPIAFTLDANVKTLTSGSGRKGVGGQVYYFRGVTSHPLVRKPKFSLALQHGPSYTLANRILGVHGHRVIRYEGSLVAQYGQWGMDVMFRPQWALQRGIPENRFWGFNVFYTFQR